MRVKVASIIAVAAALTACGSNEECMDVHGTGGAAHEMMPGSAGDFVKTAGDRVYYDFDSSMVNKAGHAVAMAQADWLKAHGQHTVTIEGHCDERGTVEYNLALGERRANAHKKALMAHGIHDDRIKTVSYGKNRPIVMGHDEHAWAMNRVSIAVLDN